MYAKVSKEYPELPDPQAMFDIHYFRDDPRPFYRFAKVGGCVCVGVCERERERRVSERLCL